MDEPMLIELPRSLEGARLVLPAWALASGLDISVESILKKAGCVDLRPVADSAALAQGYPLGPMVALGNFNDNAVVRDLYIRRLAFADSWFPGANGYEVRVLQAPSVLPHPVLLIGGSTRDGTRRAVQALEAALFRGGWSNLPLVASTLLPPPPPTEQHDAIVRRAVEDSLARGLCFVQPITVTEWLFLYHLSGHPHWGALARQGLLKLAEIHQSTPFFGPYEKGNTEIFFLWGLVTAWRVVESAPAFSEADRRSIREFIKFWGDLMAAQTYLKPGANKPGEIRQNHAISAAISMIDVHAYLSAHMDLSVWASALAEAWNIMDGQAVSYRYNDDGGGNGYAFLTAAALVHLEPPLGNYRAFESGHLARVADLAILTTDNRQEEATYGDAPTYLAWADTLRFNRRFHILPPAAWFYRNGAYQWAFEWLDRGMNLAATYTPEAGRDSFETPSARFASDVQPVYPSGYCGVSAVLLDEGALKTVDRWYSDPGRAGQAPFGTEPVLSDDRPLPIDYARWRPQPGRRYFDKISFRPSFHPADEYLLLQGPGVFCHGHRDANSISRLTWRDRLWLVDQDYTRTSPSQHNTVHVIRDGRGAAYPPLASMERICNFPGLGITRTALRQYNGTSWTRTIIWAQGRSFLVLDDIDIVEEGDYHVECLWRTLGEATLSSNRLDVAQRGPVFSILGSDRYCDETELTTVRPSPDLVLDAYPYARPEVHVLRQCQNGHWAPGERVSFANLLPEPASGSAPDAELVSLAHGLWLCNAKGVTAVAGTLRQPLRLGHVEIQAEALCWDAERLCLAGCTRLVVGGHSLSSPVPCDVDLDLRTGLGILDISADGTLPVCAGFVVDAAIKPVPSPVHPGALCPSGQARHVLSCPADSVAALAQTHQDLLAADRPKVHRIAPVPPPHHGTPRLQTVWKWKGTAPLTAAAVYGHYRLLGDAKGSVTCVDWSGRMMWQLGRQGPIHALLAAEFDGRRGDFQVCVGTGSPEVQMLSSQGALLWKADLAPALYGAGEHVNVLTLLPSASPGESLILAGTNGWHVYALTTAGTLAWHSWIKYHGVTAIAVGDLLDTSEMSIVVGTDYHTPVNVLDKHGRRLWYTWEQVGSEHRSTTVRSGTDLRVLRLVDLNADSRLEIIYGTHDMLVVALDPRDGRHLWKADVGGEVVGLEVIPAGVGMGQILVATDNGLLWQLDYSGAPLGRLWLGKTWTAMTVDSTGHIAAADKGTAWLLTPGLVPYAHCVIGKPANRLAVTSGLGGQGLFYTAGNEAGEFLWPT